ncbi:MAG: hypothetical protein HY548_04830 [Elusimicrobia bacterium]|nr:hypothetical protein [Elusimicrobiota bacterium]
MKNRWYWAWILMSGLMMGTGPVQATVQSDIQNDSKKTAEWFSKQVAEIMAFNTASTPLLPGDVLKVLGFEFGVAGGVSSSKLDVKGFRGIKLTAIDNAGGEISLPENVLAPGAVAHAKVGLPKGIDLGFKYGSLNFDDKTSDAKTDFKNTVIGVEVRKRLLGGGMTGVVAPDIALSAAYDSASGEITRKERYNAPLRNGVGTLTADTTWKTEWNSGAVTARAVASKTLLIITPYAGVGYTMLVGGADSTITTSGTLTPADPVDGAAVSQKVTGSADADKSFFQAVGGAEISFLPFMRLNLGYLWSEEDWAASAGLRLQFR